MILPILEGDSRSSSDGSRFRPRRGSGETGESSGEEGRKPKGEKGAAFGGFFDNLEGSDDYTSSSSEGGKDSPSSLRKVAWAWERRALRAEESLKRYKEGLMERSEELKLHVTLSSILNSDSGVMDERNIETESGIGNWHSRAFDTMPGDV